MTDHAVKTTRRPTSSAIFRNAYAQFLIDSPPIRIVPNSFSCNKHRTSNRQWIATRASESSLTTEHCPLSAASPNRKSQELETGLTLVLPTKRPVLIASQRGGRGKAAIVVPILVLLSAIAAAAQAPAKLAVNSLHLIFSGAVQGSQDCQLHIGGDLIFQLKLVSKGGWEIQVVPEANPALDPDYSFVATPPAPEAETRYLYPSPSEPTAQAVLAYSPRNFQFLVNPSEYGPLALLWSEYENGGSPDVLGKIQQAIGNAAKGTGILTILGGKVREPKNQQDVGSVSAIDFRVDLALPCDFDAPPPMTGLAVDRSACAQKVSAPNE